MLGADAARRSFALRSDDHVMHWEAMRAGCGIAFTTTYLAALTPALRRLPGSADSAAAGLADNPPRNSRQRPIRTVFDFSPGRCRRRGHHIVTQSGGYIFFMKAPFNKGL